MEPEWQTVPTHSLYLASSTIWLSYYNILPLLLVESKWEIIDKMTWLGGGGVLT